jgi:drug/metabolite transporter (DMT)-like permease
MAQNHVAERIAEMNWVLLSLVSAAAFTVLTVLQKRTLDRHIQGVVPFNAVAAIIQVSIASVLLLLSPTDWFSGPVLLMVGVGAIQAFIWLLQGYAINREADVSRIVPVLDSFPLLVLIIAVVFLGEVLTPVKWFAVLVVIAGVLLASWHQALPGERVRLNRSLVAIFGATVGMALLTVSFKVASADLSVMQMIGLSWLFAAPFHFIAASVTHSGSEVRRVLRSRPAFGMVGLTQVMILIALFSGLAALSIGPVSLTTAIMGTRPVMLVLWVLASGISFKRAASGTGPRKPLRARLASASLVTVGVGVMAF